MSIQLINFPTFLEIKISIFLIYCFKSRVFLEKNLKKSIIKPFIILKNINIILQIKFSKIRFEKSN